MKDQTRKIKALYSVLVGAFLWSSLAVADDSNALMNAPIIQEEIVITEEISQFILDTAQYAVENSSVDELSEGLFKCCIALKNGKLQLMLVDLVDAFPSMVNYFNTIVNEQLKAPRPSNSPGIAGGLLGCGAEILPFLQSIQSAIDACCESLQQDFQETFNILNDIQLSLIECCTTLQADFDLTFSLLASLNPTTSIIINFNNEFQSTWTILADLKATLTACCTSIQNNFDSTFTSISSLNSTFTSCCAELTQEINSTLTVLSSIQTTLTECCSSISITLTNISGSFSATFTVLGELQTTLTQCCTDIAENFAGTFSVLESSFNDTFTLLTSIQNTLTLCCASSSDCLETFTTLTAGFNGTFTALAEINNTLTECCAEIAANFAGTFSTLAAGFNSLSDINSNFCNPTFIRQSDFGAGGSTYTISAPGVYKLAENIVFTPVGGIPAIAIVTSGVTLDLQCFTLSQGNSTAGVDGIQVFAGFDSFTIENGTIANFTRTGISLLANDNLFTIQNLTCLACEVRGIDISFGLDGTIKNCLITQCCQGATGDYALLLDGCVRVSVEKTELSSNGSAAHGLSVIRLSAASNCAIEEVTLLDNTASTTLFGLEILATSSCNFTACDMRLNTATNHVVGIYLSGAANTSNIFTDCNVLRSTAGTTINGIFLNANSNNNLFIGCEVNWNAGGSVIGVFLTGGGTNNLYNSFIDCIITGNSATGANNTCRGFFVDGADYSMIVRNIISFNSSAASLAIGINFGGAGTGDNWEVKDTQTIRNIGVNDASSFGILNTAGVNNLFTRDISFNNGITAGNQLSGVPAGSVSTQLSTNLNAITSPWTNIAVAS